MQKYDEYKIIYEVMCTILIMFFVALMSLHCFLKTPWKNFSQARVHYFVMQQKLMQKKSAAQTEKNITYALKNWQKKHPNFYHAIKNISATQDRSEILTKIIQQSQCIITHVSSHRIDHEISVQATTNFYGLLTLLSLLNKNALPFTLTQLSIDHVNQFNLQFSERETYAKK